MIGTTVVSTEQIIRMREEEANSFIPVTDKASYDSLYSYILERYRENRDTKESSGVNRLLLESLRSYNGEYDTEDLQAIREIEGGSEIFMNLTSTKVRAAISWIKDILLGTTDAFSIRTTPVPTLPEEIYSAIKDKISEEFDSKVTEAQGAQQIAQTLKDINELKRDLEEAIQEELQKEASFSFKLLEKAIKDTLKEGHFDDALSHFIDNFCIFPTAILKGPIVCKRKKLKWEGGEAVVDSDGYIFKNKAISPFDIYPAPEASTPQDGAFIEYMRLSRGEVSAMLHESEKTGYRVDKVRAVLERKESARGIGPESDGYVEQEKAEEELKDNAWEANKNLYPALHFFGPIPVDILRMWGMTDGIEDMDPMDTCEVEAIVVSSEVVKCVKNPDPLGRRPYYIASFQRRPNSFWGSSIPMQMRDIQRMCNACARSLANNMGLSAGPVMELVVDRLADGYEVEKIKPRDIVQVTSDPTGGGGRAVSFFTIPSNAQELLAVYQTFEQKADDVTMIPRYIHGGEKTQGAAQTASGLSMLLESASKGIKDAIRHIDEGVIVPRVEREFYHLMLTGQYNDFKGDINVVALGSQTLTLKGAEQMRRNEFLQLTANAVDQRILGVQGRATILRKMAADLGFGENIVPSRQELKAMVQAEQEAAAQNQQMNNGVAIVERQVAAQLEIANQNTQVKLQELQQKQEKVVAELQLKVMQLQQDAQASEKALMAQLQAVQIKGQQKAESDNKAIALSLKTGDKSQSV